MKNKNLLKILTLILYFINEGKITPRNFKKLKYLLYLACFDYYEKHWKTLIDVEFEKDKKGDLKIKLK